MKIKSVHLYQNKMMWNNRYKTNNNRFKTLNLNLKPKKKGIMRM